MYTPLMCDRSYGARLEIRVNNQMVPHYVNCLSDPVHVNRISSAVRWFKAKDLFYFALDKVRALDAMVKAWKHLSNLCTLGFLTSCAVASYLLNLTFHEENRHSWWRPVRRLVHDKKNPGSKYPFLGLSIGRLFERFLVHETDSLTIDELGGFFNSETIRQPSQSRPPQPADTPHTSSPAIDVNARTTINDISDALESMEYVPSQPGYDLVIMVTGDVIFNQINFLNTTDSYYFHITKRLFCILGLDNPHLVRLYTQLLLNEWVTLFTRWNDYDIDPSGGYKMFLPNYQNRLPPNKINVSRMSPCLQWLTKYLLPNVDTVVNDYESSIFQTRTHLTRNSCHAVSLCVLSFNNLTMDKIFKRS